MTDLTTKTAQSLHDKWCEQMREKGFHGPKEDCTHHDKGQRTQCSRGMGRDHRCYKFDSNLAPWPDLPESLRQEYLATAKAVLPEIVKTEWDEATEFFEALILGWSNNERSLGPLIDFVKRNMCKLRARRLEELKK